MWTHEIIKSALYLCSVVMKCQSMMSKKEFKLSLSVVLSRACSFLQRRIPKEVESSGFCGMCWPHTTRGQHCQYCLWALGAWSPVDTSSFGALPSSPTTDALGSGLLGELGCREGWVPYLLANVYFLFNLNVWGREEGVYTQLTYLSQSQCSLKRKLDFCLFVFKP